MLKLTIMPKLARLFLVALLFLLIILNFRWGYFILGNDNYSPEENPGLSLTRYLTSPLWRAYRGLGVTSDAEQVDWFRSLVFFIFQKIGFPLWLISQLSVWLTFFLGVWSAAHLGEKLLGKKAAFLPSGIFYFTNMLTISLFFSPLKPFIFVWGFLPLFLWRSLALLQKIKPLNIFWWALSLLCLQTGAIIPTIFLVVIFTVFIFFTLFYLLGLKLKKVVILFLIFLAFQLYWLLPFVNYVLTYRTALRDSYINRMITPNTIQLENKYNTFVNIPRYYTNWLDNRRDNGELVFRHSLLYQKNLLFIIFSWLTPLLALFGILVLFRQKKWSFLPLVFLAFFGFLLLSPLSPLNLFTPPNPAFAGEGGLFSLFRQVFRWPSSKFWPLINLSLPFLAGFGLMAFIGKLPKFFQRPVLGGVLLCQLIFVFPFFKQELVGRADFVQIPKAYFNLKDYLAKNDPLGRIYVAPEANMLYFRNYQWGFYGSVFLNYLVPNPLMEKAFTVGSPLNEQAQKAIINAYYSENPAFFTRALADYQMAYVLSDRSVSSEKNGYAYNWQVHEKVVDRNPQLQKVWQEEFLTLYKVSSANLPAGQAGLQPTTYNLQPITFDSIKAVKDGLVLSQTYLPAEGSGAEVRYIGLEQPDPQAGPDDLPISASYNPDSRAITLRPALPELKRNGETILSGQNYGGIEITLPEDSAFVSLADLVWDLAAEPQKVFALPFGQLKEENLVKVWPNQPNQLQSTINNQQLAIDNDSLLQLTFTLQSDSPRWLTFCVHSLHKQRCLNRKENSFWAKPQTKTITLLLDSVVEAGDTLNLWLPENANFKIDSLELFSINFPLFIPSFPSQPSLPSFHFSPGDQLQWTLPFITGEESYFFSSASQPLALPALFTQGKIAPENGALQVSAKEETSGFWLELPAFPGGNQVMLVAAGAKNNRGIPLDLSFRDQKREYKLWTERMGFEQENQIFEIFMAPEASHNYLFEVSLNAQGRDVSVNQLNFLLLQPLPAAWVNLLTLQQENSLNTHRSGSNHTNTASPITPITPITPGL